ncbi:MAG: cyclopropane-fatty-acyl-phospholipid synthase family protein [Candidatus Lokiarchaeia archaeon]
MRKLSSTILSSDLVSMQSESTKNTSNDSLALTDFSNACQELDAFLSENGITLYNLPKYYDIAFSRDVTGEIAFYKKCFRNYCNFEVKRILEPACGSGIFLVAFPKYGYHIIGYDICSKMVDYTKERIINAGCIDKAEVLLGDMKTMKFDPKFDAAIISINSLGYLLLDNDIISHFRNMSQSLKKGGLYIVEIVCAYDDLNKEKKSDETWCAERDGIKIEATWNPYSYDRENKIRHINFRMKVQDNGRTAEFEEKHELRLWLCEDFKRLTQEAGFRIEAIYNQEYQEIPIKTRITGELGALYYVLVNE